MSDNRFTLGQAARLLVLALVGFLVWHLVYSSVLSALLASVANSIATTYFAGAGLSLDGSNASEWILHSQILVHQVPGGQVLLRSWELHSFQNYTIGMPVLCVLLFALQLDSKSILRAMSIGLVVLCLVSLIAAALNFVVVVGELLRQETNQRVLMGDQIVPFIQPDPGLAQTLEPIKTVLFYLQAFPIWLAYLLDQKAMKSLLARDAKTA